QVVRALVEQGAAAVLLPAAPPAAGGVVGVGAVPVGHRPADPLDAAQFAAVHQRSEERRVGKGCRAGGWPGRGGNKTERVWPGSAIRWKQGEGRRTDRQRGNSGYE